MSSMNKTLPAASDVARLAGVSQSAVSRAFTEGASISARTREKVMAAAQQLGYRPNQLARSLLKGRSNIVGVALGNLENPFFTQVLDRLSQRLSAVGQRVLIFTATANAEVDAELEEMLDYRVDALILMSTTLSSSLANQCEDTGIPVIFLNRTGYLQQCCSVTGDNVNGARQIAAHLLECGYQHIAFMAGFQDSSTSSEREQAFTQYLLSQGKLAPIREVGDFSRQGAMEATRRLLNRPQRPDAIFCANDHMALATLDVVRYEFGLIPGQDIGIAGFDDVSAANWPGNKLTTFSQPVQPMVDSATEFVLGAGQGSRDQQHVVIPGELIIRDSTCPR